MTFGPAMDCCYSFGAETGLQKDHKLPLQYHECSVGQIWILFSHVQKCRYALVHCGDLVHMMFKFHEGCAVHECECFVGLHHHLDVALLLKIQN